MVTAISTSKAMKKMKVVVGKKYPFIDTSKPLFHSLVNPLLMVYRN